MTTFETVLELLASQATRHPHRIALCAPGGGALTYGDLHLRVTDFVAALRRHGIGRQDRVAIVLPGGLDLALSFLGVAAGAVSAPLNPAYREDEFEFYLADLGARGLIVPQSEQSAAVRVAARLGIPILRLVRPPSAVVGSIGMESGTTWSEPPGSPAPDDIALVLHTSGTTNRPKAVPLTQANICASAEHVRRALDLSEADRCLNVMPLFHVHGLVASLLASLAAGGSVACAPGFLAPEFFDWLRELQPTWYTAVPTMHQSILARARSRSDAVARGRLRFIRSSSASLPPAVMAELETVFGVPVIEAFGMTEAAHQVASNPLPPRRRKAGSVGLAAGPEVAILGETGALLPAGSIGEVVVRGPNVMRGYLGNPEANSHAFHDGWFRTGDQGLLDEDGYLSLTGRLKELINRGGEKIAPREVEEVLLGHPAVGEVAVFAVPHHTLGEDVGAVIVPRPGSSPGERELRDYVASRLAGFKVPGVLLLYQEIPKGPTGKVQRIGLAARLGIANADAPEALPSAPMVAPRTPLEARLARLWSQVLRVEPPGVHDHFLDLGGDSMLAARLVSRIRDELRVELEQRSLFDAPTIAQQAVVIDRLFPAGSAR